MINNFESSAFILDKINFKIQESYNLTVQAENGNLTREQNQKLFYYMMEYGMILVLSYLDELRRHFYPNLKKEKPPGYVKGLKAVIGFLIAEINSKFPDLRKFRNNYLAHNMRIDEVDNVFVYGGLRKYRVPQNMLDYTLLIHCISMVDNILQLEFPEAVKNFDEFQKSSSLDAAFVPTVHNSPETAKSYILAFTDEAQRRYSLFQIQNLK